MTTVIFIIVGVIIIGAAGWYLLSPLFIDKKVDEKFPEAVRTPSFSIPSPEELERMTEADREAMKEEVMGKAAQMPPKVMDETMPLVGEMPDGGMREEGSTVGDTEMTSPKDSAGVQEPRKLSSGTFQGADSFHQGSGSTGVYRLADGSHILRFEDFAVTNGPDLRVLLAKNRNPRESVELAPLKGNRGNQNYTVPSDVNVSDYNSVIIYCKPFRVVFATAELKESR